MKSTRIWRTGLARQCRSFITGAVLSVALPMTAAVSYERVHSFGLPELMGESPSAPPIQASDGWLYGTTGEGGRFGLGVLYRVNQDGTGYHAFWHFGSSDDDAQNPLSGLTEGSDGALYGVTDSGGNLALGTVFKINKNGTNYLLLHHFGSGLDGQNPNSRLRLTSDGFLYGTALYGGLDNQGTLFRLRPDGSAYTNLHSFGAFVGDGEGPLDGVLEGSDGHLYGVTSAGGDFAGGSVYQVNKDGSAYNVIYSFAGGMNDGIYPAAGLIEGSDGFLYGTTDFGGGADAGVVFQLSKDGMSFTIVYDFGRSVNDGQAPEGQLLEGSDGGLYGTTAQGGSAGEGTIFRMDKNGMHYKVLHDFAPAVYDGSDPQSALVEATNGVLFGVTQMGGKSDRGSLFKLTKDGGNYTQAHTFNATGGDGQYGWSGVIEASDGLVYGACVNGGFFDGGAVFRMNKDGSGYVVLHHFAPETTNGMTPWGSVIEGSDGALYGATRHGGLLDAGTVFKLNKDGSGFGLLRSFTTNAGEGAFPIRGVIEASDGKLYGRTISGGSNDAHCIFSLNKDGSGYTNLHSFGRKFADYYVSTSGLIEGSDGALYGTTPDEGAYGAGMVFKMNKDGSGFHLLHEFKASGPDGRYPGTPNLMEASNGRLYGATDYGGTNDSGTLFSMNNDGSDYRVLHIFAAIGDDGYSPSSTVVEGPGGLLYGTTYFGGNADQGTLYVINKDGSDFSTIYRFLDDSMDGFNPNVEMIRASDGALYGTTFLGGEFASGTIFRIKPVALSAIRTADVLTVTLEGFIGHRYAVDAANSIPAAWNQVATVTNRTGSVQFAEPGPLKPERFYRARVLEP